MAGEGICGMEMDTLCGGVCVSVGACGHRDECLLSAAAKSEKRAHVPVPRMGPFDAEVLGGLGLQ